MAKMDWDKLKQKSRYKPTQEEIDRRQRMKNQRGKLKEARIKFKEERNPGMATKKQMKFIRRHKLMRDTSITVLSFLTASKLIKSFIKKQKKERKNGKTKNTNTRHRWDVSGTCTT